MIIKLYLNQYKTYKKCETRIRTTPSKARTATDAHKHAAHIARLFLCFCLQICSKKKVDDDDLPTKKQKMEWSFFFQCSFVDLSWIKVCLCVLFTYLITFRRKRRRRNELERESERAVLV